MDDKITIQPTQNKISPSSQINPDIPGKISQVIGSGKHAQAAIVWQTIRWSFLAGAAFSLLYFFLSLYNDKKEIPLDEIRGIWSIFIPVITLALGYIFGKGKE